MVTVTANKTVCCYMYFDLDSTSPTIGTLIINNGEAYSSSGTVNVNLTYTDSDVSHYCLTEESGSNNCEWIETSSSPISTLFTLSSGYGSKTVYAYLKDYVGNISNPFSSNIRLNEVIDVPNQSGTLTYSGSIQSPSWNNYDTNKLSIGGTTSGTNAGIYTATFTPNEGYAWSDGTSTSKSVDWTIGKASGSLSLSSSSVSINIGASLSVTATRSGDGTISAVSDKTSVATVSVSGTTITITGKASGSATITVSVAAGTNHTVPTNKIISVSVIAPVGTYLRDTLKPNGLNTVMEGGLYRFQGTNSTVNNYICFGTSDKTTCTSDTDKYMYRIIGINSSGQLKLIKKEALNTAYKWHSSTSSNTTWPNSDLFKGINGSYFLNTSYVSSEWNQKISTVSWKYGDISSAHFDAPGMYSAENSLSSTVDAKVGLLYMHDWYYAYQSGGLNCGPAGDYKTCGSAWLDIANCDSTNGYSYEWILTRCGYTDGMYWAWFLNRNAIFNGNYISINYVSTLSAVRPIFYINFDVGYLGGTGTLDDPILIQ